MISGVGYSPTGIVTLLPAKQPLESSRRTDKVTGPVPVERKKITSPSVGPSMVAFVAVQSNPLNQYGTDAFCSDPGQELLGAQIWTGVPRNGNVSLSVDGQLAPFVVTDTVTGPFPSATNVMAFVPSPDVIAALITDHA